MRLLTVILALTPSMSFASDSNLPVWAIRAEVLSGSNAAQSCSKDVNVVVAPEDYVKCIRGKHDLNRRFAVDDNEAFDAGLYYRERQTLQSIASAAGAAQSYFDYVQMCLDRANAHYMVARDKIGASDEQIKSEVGAAGSRI
jgi:hypothetical protein